MLIQKGNVEFLQKYLSLTWDIKFSIKQFFKSCKSEMQFHINTHASNNMAMNEKQLHMFLQIYPRARCHIALEQLST